jgi:hypothetical protein
VSTVASENKQQTAQPKSVANNKAGAGIAAPAVPVLQQKEAEESEHEHITQKKEARQFASKNDNSEASGIAQSKHNNTGMPDNLKSGVENLSGMDMSDVKVHYNSSHPAQLNALAYAQGNDIHLGPGQEQHLPHEAWHVVQQRQGRVQATKQMKGGVNVNDDPGLEHEADVMGAKALQMVSASSDSKAYSSASSVAQLIPIQFEGEENKDTKPGWFSGVGWDIVKGVLYNELKNIGKLVGGAADFLMSRTSVVQELITAGDEWINTKISGVANGIFDVVKNGIAKLAPLAGQISLIVSVCKKALSYWDMLTDNIKTGILYLLGMFAANVPGLNKIPHLQGFVVDADSGNYRKNIQKWIDTADYVLSGFGMVNTAVNAVGDYAIKPVAKIASYVPGLASSFVSWGLSKITGGTTEGQVETAHEDAAKKEEPKQKEEPKGKGEMININHPVLKLQVNNLKLGYDPPVTEDKDKKEEGTTSKKSNPGMIVDFYLQLGLFGMTLPQSTGDISKDDFNELFFPFSGAIQFHLSKNGITLNKADKNISNLITIGETKINSLDIIGSEIKNAGLTIAQLKIGKEFLTLNNLAATIDDTKFKFISQADLNVAGLNAKGSVILTLDSGKFDSLRVFNASTNGDFQLVNFFVDSVYNGDLAISKEKIELFDNTLTAKGIFASGTTADKKITSLEIKADEFELNGFGKSLTVIEPKLIYTDEGKENDIKSNLTGSAKSLTGKIAGANIDLTGLKMDKNKGEFTIHGGTVKIGDFVINVTEASLTSTEITFTTASLSYSAAADSGIKGVTTTVTDLKLNSNGVEWGSATLDAASLKLGSFEATALKGKLYKKGQKYNYILSVDEFGGNVENVFSFAGTKIHYNSDTKKLSAKSATAKLKALDKEIIGNITKPIISEEGVDWEYAELTVDSLSIGSLLTASELNGTLKGKRENYAYTLSAGTFKGSIPDSISYNGEEVLYDSKTNTFTVEKATITGDKLGVNASGTINKLKASKEDEVDWELATIEKDELSLGPVTATKLLGTVSGKKYNYHYTLSAESFGGNLKESISFSGKKISFDGATKTLSADNADAKLTVFGKEIVGSMTAPKVSENQITWAEASLSLEEILIGDYLKATGLKADIRDKSKNYSYKLSATSFTGNLSNSIIVSGADLSYESESRIFSANSAQAALDVMGVQVTGKVSNPKITEKNIEGSIDELHVNTSIFAITIKNAEVGQEKFGAKEAELALKNKDGEASESGLANGFDLGLLNHFDGIKLTAKDVYYEKGKGFTIGGIDYKIEKIEIDLFGVKAIVDPVNRSISIKSGDIKFPGTSPLWPFKLDVPIPIFIGVSGNFGLEIGGGVALNLNAEASREPGKDMPYKFSMDTGITGNLYVKVAAGLELGSRLLVALQGNLYAQAKAEAKGNLKMKGEVNHMGGLNFEPSKSAPLSMSYSLISKIIAEVGGELRVKAFLFYDKELKKITFKDWNLGEWLREGELMSEGGQLKETDSRSGLNESAIKDKVEHDFAEEQVITNESDKDALISSGDTRVIRNDESQHVSSVANQSSIVWSYKEFLANSGDMSIRGAARSTFHMDDVRNNIIPVDNALLAYDAFKMTPKQHDLGEKALLENERKYLEAILKEINIYRHKLALSGRMQGVKELQSQVERKLANLIANLSKV